MHFNSIGFAWLSLKATRLQTSTLQPTIISLTSNDICILITARDNDGKLSIAIINYFYLSIIIYWYINIPINKNLCLNRNKKIRNLVNIKIYRYRILLYIGKNCFLEIYRIGRITIKINLGSKRVRNISRIELTLYEVEYPLQNTQGRTIYLFAWETQCGSIDWDDRIYIVKIQIDNIECVSKAKKT